MSAASYDFEIEQGVTLAQILTWTDSTGAPINLAGYSAKMQIRQSVDSSVVLLELSTVNGGVTIVSSTGVITLNASADATAALTFKRAKYDLELTSSTGVVTRLIEGEVTLSKEVTR